jgi:hypothetical protein
MNKIRYIGWIFLALALFLFYKSEETKSILVVLNQRIEAAENSKLMVYRNGVVAKTRFNLRRYVDGLHRINTLHCPKKFQLAWLDYVQACERLEKMPGRMIADLFIGIATRSPFSLIKDVPKTEESGDELLLAEQNLERVALEYDVRIIHK